MDKEKSVLVTGGAGYDGWYERKLGGKKHMKIILGSPQGVTVKRP